MWLNYQRPADVNAIYTFLRHIPVLLWLLLLVTSTVVNIAIHLTINVDKTKVMATWKKNKFNMSYQQRETATGGDFQIPRSPDHWWCRMRKRHPCNTWKRYRDFKVYAETLAKSWHINRHKSSIITNHCMVGCYLRVRRLDVKEIQWVTNRSFWNEGIKIDTSSLMDSKKNQWMDSEKKLE